MPQNALVNAVRKWRRPALAQVDPYGHIFDRACQSVQRIVDDEVHAVEAFLAGLQDAVVAADLLSDQDLGAEVDMMLQVEHAASQGFQDSDVDADFGQYLVTAQFVQPQVVLHVDMAIMVFPFRRDRHDQVGRQLPHLRDIGKFPGTHQHGSPVWA